MKQKFLALLAIFALVAFSCKKEPKPTEETPEPDAMEVATTSFVAEKGDGTIEIPVSANVKLSATISDDAKDWLYYVETKAMVDSKVVVGYRANPTTKQRTGKVTITGGTIKTEVSVTQAAGDPTLTLAAEGQKVNPRGETISVAFTTNDAVNVTPSVSWIKVKSIKDGAQELEITLNDTGAAREGVVTFATVTDASVKADFAILQKAANIDPNAISILALGNTAVTDAMNYLYPVLKELGYTTIRLGNLYIGDSDVDKHVASIADSTVTYKFNYIKDEAWATADATAFSVLEPEDWDYIVLSQNTDKAVDAASYAAVKELEAAVRVTNPFTPIVWNMGWAPKGNTEAYETVADVMATVIKADKEISAIIPAGTALQNLRTSFMGDNVTRSDNKNLSYNIGRPVAAYTWAAALTGKSIDALTYVPDDKNGDGKLIYQFEPYYLPAMLEAVNAAIKTPFKVTATTTYAPRVSKVDMNLLKAGMASLGYPESMLANYIELPMVMIPDAFYNSGGSFGGTVAAAAPSNLCAGFTGSTGTTQNGFMATLIFSHDQIPVGSMIVLLDNTLQYRPEGWTALSATNSKRPDNVTAPVVSVSDDWWGSFKYRAFNISKKAGGAMTQADWEKVLKSFAIFIPKTALDDGLEDYLNGNWNW